MIYICGLVLCPQKDAKSSHTQTLTLYLEWPPIAMATLAYWLMGRLYPTADAGLFFICEDLLNGRKVGINETHKNPIWKQFSKHQKSQKKEDATQTAAEEDEKKR